MIRLPKKIRRSPAWVITFADLVTIMLAFFVLMLSFSATDPDQYHEVSDSMASAFADDLGGVFDRVSLVRLGIPISDFSANQSGELSIGGSPLDGRRVERAPLRTYLRLTAVLRREIKSEMIQVELSGSAVVIRVSDLAFSKGKETMMPSLGSVIARISSVLGETDGMIVIQGHTDDVPISTRRFRSNWELSTERAVSVVHELLKSEAIDQSRVVVQGHADSRPIVPNDSPEHRAQNRRVEIHVSNRP